MIEAFEKLSLTSSQYYTQLSTSQFSQRLINTPPIRKLDSIVITNFKSFKGKVYVGPLLDFTSIIGPNGAGKSNILDALMFCLCNEKNKLTFYDIREFIQRDGDETYKQMSQKYKFCEVEAHFIVGQDRKLSFKRTLYPNENQEFAIDGEVYKQNTYENFLMRCNINHITSNFAIWQGEVDKLLLKNPKELTDHLQNISGSAYYKKDQLKLKQELDKVDEVAQVETAKLIKLRLEKKNLKKFFHTKDNTVKTQQEYEGILKKILMAKMVLSEMEIKQMEKEYDAVDKQEKRKIKELNESKIKMQKEQAEKIEIQNRMNFLMKEVGQNNSIFKNIEKSANILDIQALKELENQVQLLKRYSDNLKNRKNQLERQSFNLKSIDIDKQYLSLYNKWEKENEVMTKELAKKKTEYIYSEQLLRSKKGILDQFHQKAQRMEKLQQEQQRKRQDLEANVEELNKSIARLNAESSKATQLYTANMNTLQDHYAKCNEVNEKIIELEGFMVENIENEKDKELIHKLGGIQGFKGLIEQWVKPAAKKYELCFQIMLGSILKYILSTDEQSSKQIAAKLRENGQIRTLIILSNVNEKKEHITRAAIGKHGHLAIDSIDFDKGLQKLDAFLREYLSGKVICDNLESAWALLGQNIRGIKEIYTLDGNVLRHDGIISTYGSIDVIKNKYKYVNGTKSRTLAMEEIQSLQKQKAAIEDNIKTLKEKVSDDRMAKYKLELTKLEAKKEQLITNINIIKKGVHSKKEVKIPKGLEQEIDELFKRVQGIRDSMKIIEKEMLNSKIFSDFIKKNKINDLDSFRSLEDISSLEAKMKIKNKVAREFEQTQREIAKIIANLASKQEKLNKLAERVNNVVSQEKKAELIRNIKQGEEELTNLRIRLGKLSNINIESLKFKSQIPQIDSKLLLLRQRHENMVKAEVAQLGLDKPPEPSQFKQLEKNLETTLNRATKDLVNDIREELVKQSKELEAELEKQHLGMSSFDEAGSNGEKIDKQIETIEATLNECNEKKAKISTELTSIKQNRKKIFMNFFDSLRPILQNAYQVLTGNSDGVSGKVDIYLQNEDFPCDGGVYYYPTPPTKRFVYDLDQLSGGQKSIASLALQYSIAIASKSPFLMLDEIDAFLDSQNVAKFVDLVNSSIREKSLQFILVTHKRSLFLKGKSLVGVTKSQTDPFSKAFSLFLDEDEEEDT